MHRLHQKWGYECGNRCREGRVVYRIAVAGIVRLSGLGKPVRYASFERATRTTCLYRHPTGVRTRHFVRTPKNFSSLKL